MNRDDVIRMVRQATDGHSEYSAELPDPEGQELEVLMKFAALVAASERFACGEVANKKAAEVLAKNTYRGRTSSAASFAASMLEDVGAEIRMRSNVEIHGPRSGPVE